MPENANQKLQKTEIGEFAKCAEREVPFALPALYFPFGIFLDIRVLIEKT